MARGTFRIDPGSTSPGLSRPSRSGLFQSPADALGEGRSAGDMNIQDKVTYAHREWENIA